MRPLLVLALCLGTAPAFADPHPLTAKPPTGPEAVILDYSVNGGPSDYRIDGDRGIYVLISGGQWFYLRVTPDCPRLAAVQGFSIDAGPQGQVDRFSTISVEGQRCLLSSVVRSGPPPGWYSRHRRR